jgi:accessory gene regulator protein AgrB
MHFFFHFFELKYFTLNYNIIYYIGNIIHEIMLFESFRFCCQYSKDLHASSILSCLVLNRIEVDNILYI